MHLDLIGPYIRSKIQHQPGGAIIKNNVSLTCMTMVDPATSSFKTVKVPMFDLNEVTGGNDDYIDKLSSKLTRFLNNTWQGRYPCPHKVVFDNRYGF